MKRFPIKLFTGKSNKKKTLNEVVKEAEEAEEDVKDVKKEVAIKTNHTWSHNTRPLSLQDGKLYLY